MWTVPSPQLPNGNRDPMRFRSQCEESAHPSRVRFLRSLPTSEPGIVRISRDSKPALRIELEKDFRHDPREPHARMDPETEKADHDHDSMRNDVLCRVACKKMPAPGYPPFYVASRSAQSQASILGKSRRRFDRR